MDYNDHVANIEKQIREPTTPGATTMTENYSKSQQKRMAIQRGEATAMTPMSEERLRELTGMTLRSTELELLSEVHRLRTLPPDVAAAMERYAKHIESENGPTSSPYARPRGGLTAEWLMDQELIAAHFTALFTEKGA